MRQTYTTHQMLYYIGLTDKLTTGDTVLHKLTPKLAKF